MVSYVLPTIRIHSRRLARLSVRRESPHSQWRTQEGSGAGSYHPGHLDGAVRLPIYYALENNRKKIVQINNYKTQLS